MIPSSLVISDGLRKPYYRTFGVDPYPDMLVVKLNRAQGGANRFDVHVKVVGLEETQKVGKGPSPDPIPGFIDFS